jgi:hypothetical protein
MEQSPEPTGPPPRRGPSVDLDPTGIVTGKQPDRQRRQFLNDSFYRSSPAFFVLFTYGDRRCMDRKLYSWETYAPRRDTPMFARARTPLETILTQMANVNVD